jgi:hypothetical protein
MTGTLVIASDIYLWITLLFVASRKVNCVCRVSLFKCGMCFCRTIPESRSTRRLLLFNKIGAVCRITKFAMLK